MIAIATEQIETVIRRLATDKAFRMKYSQDPDGCLGAYLSPEEIQAIKTGDSHRLQQMGCGSWDELITTLCGPNPGS